MPKRYDSSDRWNRENPEKRRDVNRRSMAKRATRNKEIIAAAKSQACADCEVEYPPYVMDFDHQRDKTMNIGKEGHRCSTAKLIAEIAKCEVVCANCHRERHHGILPT